MTVGGWPDVPIVETRNVPRGTAFLIDGRTLVLGTGPEWPAPPPPTVPQMLARMRRELREHLAGLVKAAEERLALLPCEHPRAGWPERDEARRQLVVRCGVCGEVLTSVDDEAAARFRSTFHWHLPTFWPPDPRAIVKIVGI